MRAGARVVVYICGVVVYICGILRLEDKGVIYCVNNRGCIYEVVD